MPYSFILRRFVVVGLSGTMVLLASCLSLIKPRRPYNNQSTVSVTDYGKQTNWAALPTRVDLADAVPTGSGLHDQQATAVADVFFVHPTSYFGRKSWNASLENKVVNDFTDKNIIRKQASVFNGSARVYAPRYRQATLFAFFDEKDNYGQQALDLAYSDVKAAFQYYLAHYNQGRPLIIASHSQGTVHATRLLREFFDQDAPLRRQLVAAYLIGFNVPIDSYQVLQPCQDSTQTGCYVGWNSVERGKEFPLFASGVVTNPLTWTTDTTAAPASLNIGSVPQSFDRLDRATTGAQVHNGLLWIEPPTSTGYPRFVLPGQPALRASFHIADYGLFYLNLRRNVATRVRAYQQQ